VSHFRAALWGSEQVCLSLGVLGSPGPVSIAFRRDAVEVGEELLREAAEIAGKFGRADGVVQGLAHFGEDIMQWLGELGFGPISFPACAEHKEEIGGPAVGVGAAFGREEAQKILKCSSDGGKIPGLRQNRLVSFAEKRLEFRGDGFAVARISDCGPSFIESGHGNHFSGPGTLRTFLFYPAASTEMNCILILASRNSTLTFLNSSS